MKVELKKRVHTHKILTPKELDREIDRVKELYLVRRRNHQDFMEKLKLKKSC